MTLSPVSGACAVCATSRDKIASSTRSTGILKKKQRLADNLQRKKDRRYAGKPRGQTSASGSDKVHHHTCLYCYSGDRPGGSIRILSPIVQVPASNLPFEGDSGERKGPIKDIHKARAEIFNDAKVLTRASNCELLGCPCLVSTGDLAALHWQVTGDNEQEAPC